MFLSSEINCYLCNIIEKDYNYIMGEIDDKNYYDFYGKQSLELIDVIDKKILDIKNKIKENGGASGDAFAKLSHIRTLVEEVVEL